MADPDLHLRVYLDARMVEVLGWISAPRHETLRQLMSDSSRELDRRWSKNIMLGKWLDYLQDMGHRFRSPMPPSLAWKLSIASPPAPAELG